MSMYINMIAVISCNNWVWGLVGDCKMSHLYPTVYPSIHGNNHSGVYTVLVINAGVCLYSAPCLSGQCACLTLCHFLQWLIDAGGRGAWGLRPADALGIIQSRTKLLCSTLSCLTYIYSNDISILLTLWTITVLTFSFIYDTLRSM